jgi:hypothetical protein
MEETRYLETSVQKTTPWRCETFHNGNDLISNSLTRIWTPVFQPAMYNLHSFPQSPVLATGYIMRNLHSFAQSPVLAAGYIMRNFHSFPQFLRVSAGLLFLVRFLSTWFLARPAFRVFRALLKTKIIHNVWGNQNIVFAGNTIFFKTMTCLLTHASG